MRHWKKVLLAVVAVVLIVWGAVGTIALFTDVESTSADDFTSGTLDITLEGGSWSGSFDNMQPGDTIVFEVTVRSVGTLPLDYDVETELTGDLAGGSDPCYVSEVKIDGVPVNSDSLSKQGGGDDSDLVEISVTMPIEASNEYEDEEGHLEVTFNAVQQ